MDSCCCCLVIDCEFLVRMRISDSFRPRGPSPTFTFNDFSDSLQGIVTNRADDFFTENQDILENGTLELLLQSR